MNKYQDSLSKYVEQLEQGLEGNKDVGSLDIIHPDKINVVRIGLLGSVELCLKYWGKNKDEEIKGMAKAIQDSLQFWLKPEGALIEFVVSQEKSRNEWRTFLAKDYRKELNELQKLVFGKGEDCIGIENDFLEIKKILKTTITQMFSLLCLNLIMKAVIFLAVTVENVLQTYSCRTVVPPKIKAYRTTANGADDTNLLSLQPLPPELSETKAGLFSGQFRRKYHIELLPDKIQRYK